MSNTTMKVHKISFSDELYDLIQLKTNKLGISIPEYVRHLVVNDIEKAQFEEATPKLEEKISNGMKDINEGRYIVIKDKEELRKFLEEL